MAPHLHCGETIYYEIYGYDGGKHIQAGYPYDCRGGEFKAMLYRVTNSTEDGFCVDLSRKQVYKRAEELGLEKPYLLNVQTCFPKREKTEQKACSTGKLIVNIINAAYDPIQKIMQLAKGKSKLDAGTLLEGVVVWFEDEDGKWTCLKHKSEEFLLDQDKKVEKDITDVEDNL